MRLVLRSDVPIAILIFETVYPDSRTKVEASRVYTPVSHVRAMVELLARNLAEYDAQVAHESQA